MPRLRPALFVIATDILALILQAPSQGALPKYQVGTIVAVAQHLETADSNPAALRYDVSVRVRDKIYTVLYSPPNSQNSVVYHVGSDVLVLVGKDTLTVSNKFNPGTTAIPILQVETTPAKPTIDWSKAPGQYFSMKMQNLTERLNLSEEQQAKIKPIAEQERGEVGAFCFTPTIPRKERLEHFQKVVQSSDAKMKPILSQSQWEKLQQLRKEQKLELKKLIAQ